MSKESKQMARENWGSSLGFILAAAGSAIGLGNIWKFPYMVGENGGGSFVLVYLLCIVLIGLPVLCSEMLIGRSMKRNVINAMSKLEQLSHRPIMRTILCLLATGLVTLFFYAHACGLVILSALAIWAFSKKGFAIAGWICTIVALVILSYYAVVGAWIVEYIWRSLSNTLTTGASFDNYISSPWHVLPSFIIFMTLTGIVVWGGIQKGIELASKILMPALFILLLIIIGRSLTLPGAMEGVKFLFKPTMEAFSPKVCLMALGQAFFSLSLGMAIAVTYGSYMKRKQNILRSAGCVGILDTLAALLAGLAIFPAVFSIAGPSGVTAGPGLIFGVLPQVFDAMFWGPVWAICFFTMLLFAAVTSSASLLECGATVFIERMRQGHKRLSRSKAVLFGFIGCTLLGFLTVASTADWSNIPWVEKATRWFMGDLTQGTWFDTVDNFASNWCLPFVAFITVLLVGWAWNPRKLAPKLLAEGDDIQRYAWLLNTWSFLVRWVAPIAILCVFLSFTGLVNFEKIFNLF
ncbi:MAG: sodium-dependent transporter [bacterium]|nr:sodium-dependent transporter [bacterium]